ncbi:hypothetical protein [Sphingomonas sp. RB1R13]|uniref:hypothetical protein n=1 Tax=Sphingomonas sp. RB1R13 TaxID=3096159 RepID=UPI002FC80561
MNDDAEKAFGKDLAPGGATLEPIYHQGKQGVVGVPVMEIKDATSSAFEERMLSVVGTFFASGAFWLGVDKLISEGPANPVFLVCLISMVCGGVVAWTGYRQSARRVNRLERYCPEV